MEHWELLFFFFFIAFVYATVGFGGGSSYLAALAIYGLPFKEIRLIALICNIIVVTGGTIVFIKHKQVKFERILPLVLASVPMAYLGARMKLSENTYFIILGCSLIVAAILLWIKTRKAMDDNADLYKRNLPVEITMGAGVGFLSGIAGIGGGIFLSPILNLANWDTAKRIAATASIFILVNSLGGIAGQLSNLPSGINYTRLILLGGAVFAGGWLGSRMGAVRFGLLTVRRVTAVLVFFAGIEVLYKHL